MKLFVVLTLVFASSVFAQTPSPSASASAKHPFTFEDMMKLKRLDEPVSSLDGKWVVFSATDVDLEANTKNSHLWIVPASGGESKRLSETPNHEERPRFSPDGKRLIWTSKATDPTQIWMCDFSSESGQLVGKPHQVTNISTGADGGIWSPDGKNIVFVSAVYPDCKDDACNKQRDDELKKSKVRAKVFTKLFYRHWNAFTEFKRSHLFVQNVEAGVSPAGTTNAVAAATSTTPRDLTPGDHDVPPFHLGGQDMYAISPDGQEVAYTSNIDEVEATSTNNEIFVVPIAVESAVPSGKASASDSGPDALRTAHATAARKISTSPGADTTPLYSPNGKYLAWRSQARAGFEADKWRLLVQDRQSGKTRDLTEKFDRSVGSFTWFSGLSNGGLFFTAEDHGESPIYALFLDRNEPTPGPRLHADDLIWQDNTSSLFFTRMSVSAPNELWSLNLSGETLGGIVEPEPVPHMNNALWSEIDMQPLEPFTFKGANDEEVQGFMVKPPGLDTNKKYPLKFLIHGGPQGAWGNSWTYRWNAE